MGKKKTWSLKKVRKELWPWRFSLFGRNPMDLRMIHFVVDNVFFKIVSVVEAIVLVSTLCFFYLCCGVRHVWFELSEPRNVVFTEPFQFSNFHRTTKLLHHTIRAFRFSKKLRDLASASVEEPEKVDLAKAAQLRFEKLSLCYEFDLAGVDAVDEELKWGMH
ncbi:hypothetical protein SDJN02_27223, partial [Cucurbita argyrosperma subsp. argyrosperma]